jgi:hypothetical protein
MTYNNSMCAHVWAQQIEDRGKTSNGNMSFDGAILYSYSTPIGRFVETVDGRRAVLVTSHSYSMTTTGKHMPALLSAIDYGRGGFALCFKVPHLWGRSGLGYMHHALTEREHAENLEFLIASYDARVLAEGAQARISQGGADRHP